MRLLFTDYTGTIPTLAGPITNTATALVLQAGQGALLPNPGQNQYFIITMFSQSTGLPGEIMWCTARSTDTLTVIRGQEGTTATAYLAGDSVAPQVTANALAAFAQIPTYAGNPNGYLAGQAGSAEQSPDAVWDTANLVLWVCTTANTNPADAVWTISSGLASALISDNYYSVHGTSSLTVPSWARVADIDVAGAGGGASGGLGGSGGGGGVASIRGVSVTPGATMTIVVGQGGAGASSAGAAGNGGSSSASGGGLGSAISATGGNGATAGPGGGGVGSGGTVNLTGQTGIDIDGAAWPSVGYAPGGSCPMGGAAGSINQSGSEAGPTGPGGGGSAQYAVALGQSGADGGVRVVFYP